MMEKTTLTMMMRIMMKRMMMKKIMMKKIMMMKDSIIFTILSFREVIEDDDNISI